nr:MAG TPA: hypothetical protein [Caudoviricetes sp.]
MAAFFLSLIWLYSFINSFFGQLSFLGAMRF